jgi:hypothetical protein
LFLTHFRFMIYFMELIFLDIKTLKDGTKVQRFTKIG